MISPTQTTNPHEIFAGFDAMNSVRVSAFLESKGVEVNVQISDDPWNAVAGFLRISGASRKEDGRWYIQMFLFASACLTVLSYACFRLCFRRRNELRCWC